MAERELHFFRQLVRELAAEKIFDSVGHTPAYAELEEALKDRRVDPYSAAERLVDGFTASL